MIENRRPILAMSSTDARAFLLKHESYCSLDLPTYFNFADLLQYIACILTIDPIDDSPRAHDDVNHTILTNKDALYTWRPITLIHPAIYASLVNEITAPVNWTTICSRFHEFQQLPQIQCLSLPAESQTHESDKAEQVKWWSQEVEQRSIELALDFPTLIHTDIVACYRSIYTHSIAWALHTRTFAKSHRRCPRMIGNTIDSFIQDMHQGQTNGIAQGSVLMDFIAEMILGYADKLLHHALSTEASFNYHILRYRDDYRIFVNDQSHGDIVLKCLAQVLEELGLQLSPAKTNVTDDVIRSSVKRDRLDWMFRAHCEEHLQTQLLIIHDHSRNHPASGSISTALTDYYGRLSGIEDRPGNLRQLISIVVDIAYSSPKTYPICTAILSKLIDFLDTPDEKRLMVEKILKRFGRSPSTGHLELWLQRISQEFGPDICYKEKLCRLLSYGNPRIWNSDWISDPEIRELIDVPSIIDRTRLDDLDPVIAIDEVQLFRHIY